MISPRTVARKAIKTYETNDPFTLAEKIGIVVGYLPLNGKILGCLTPYKGFYAIIVNTTAHDLWTSVRFTVAHELGHYFCHRHLSHLMPVLGSNDDEPGWVRRQANEFAAELLMPTPKTHQTIWEAMRRSEDPVQAVAKKFEVSLRAAAIRIDELGISVAKVI